MNWALLAKILKAIAELLDDLLPITAEANPKQDAVRAKLADLIDTIED